jgi:hypothetical protein
MDSSRYYKPRFADAAIAPNPFNGLALCSYLTGQRACGWGDLSCVGKYDWTGTSPPNIAVTLFANEGSFPEDNAAPVPGASIRACNDSVAAQLKPCFPQSGAATTDTEGLTPALTLPSDSTGDYWYFDLTPPWTNGPKTMRFYSGRKLAARDAVISLPMYKQLFYVVRDPAYRLANAPWRRDKAVLWAVPRDCKGADAFGLEVSVEVPDGGAPPSASYQANGTWVTTPCGVGASCGSATAGGVFTGLEPGPVTVIARSGGAVVAKENIVTVADSVTFLYWLEPLRGGNNQ